MASWPKLKDPADAEPYVRQNIEDGADYIKLMHESGGSMGATFAMPSLELQSALIDAAHAHVSPSPSAPSATYNEAPSIYPPSL